jgi:hypothetical protein
MQTQKVTTIAGSFATVATLCYLSLSSPSCEPYEDFFKEADVPQNSAWYDPNPYYKQLGYTLNSSAYYMLWSRSSSIGSRLVLSIP